MVARLISMLIGVEMGHVATLCGALKTTTMMSKHRDPETGMHLERMAHYSRLIARDMAPGMGLDEEFVEDIFLFAPLHDVGKIAIPDNILLKPGKLDADEFEIMQTHTTKGAEITHAMLENFNIRHLKNLHMVSNIVTYHHENMDGSGYPAGLSADRIPLEARIVAVADVFDALTSERPYKKAWSNKEAFSELESLASWKLDRECIEALKRNLNAIEEIQGCFRD
jgi:HD-GYP domain-containing protein (c-di-GMP phosphodiesterase class II)